MARKRVQSDGTDVAAAAIAWYRAELNKPAALPGNVVPERIGPTWQIGEDGKWLLPERSLGWEILGWSAVWLQIRRGEPWRYTLEQARFLLWWYAVDESGRFAYRDSVLQRLKGWGKDPLGSCVCAVEMVGPCRFSHFDANGQPVGKDNPEAWIQTAAVSMEQTKNTMRLFPGLFTDEAKAKFGLSILREKVHGKGGRLIEAVTSAPATLEGARATFVLQNETQHWNSSNGGHEMAAVIERNATKSGDGAARTMAITNAFMPGEDSVAEQTRDAYELVAAGHRIDTGVLYDSVEAPPESTLEEDAIPGVIEAIRGDSVWLNVERVAQSILDTRNPPSRSRRFWYNQVTAPEDAWLTPRDYDRLARADLPLEDGEDVALFLDTSKSDDSTALVAARMSDGLVSALGCWQRPQHAPDGWTVPRSEVDGVVSMVHERFHVVGFFADPTPGDDESGERYFDSLIDDWGLRYGAGYLVKAGPYGAVKWALSGEKGVHQRDFTAATQQTLSEILSGELLHDGGKLLRQHVVNARRRPGKWGYGIGKEHRESSRKIDLAVSMIGARMVRRLVMGSKEWNKPKATNSKVIVWG